VGVGEPLRAGVEEHLTLPVEWDLYRPMAKAATDRREIARNSAGASLG
jgi:hypothetical protein